MPVKQNMHVNAMVLGVNQGIHNAVVMVTQQLADQGQRYLDRMASAVDFRQEGMMGSVILPVA
jgi:hypothetical protein